MGHLLCYRYGALTDLEGTMLSSDPLPLPPNSTQSSSAWEQEIDGLAYELYGLTEEEVKVVEEGA